MQRIQTPKSLLLLTLDFTSTRMCNHAKFIKRRRVIQRLTARLARCAPWKLQLLQLIGDRR